ncbi:hypothetical protein COLO4_05150 [Corchorus olitorius]|uniref:Uncharacterized protein n=1 Tax=Corchorus olitorius TaxID=93759 RepID=A0A1R3KRR7_9ROSI|nr:hypothetical protein COLO4_05150 [Corchorus olitorius]
MDLHHNSNQHPPLYPFDLLQIDKSIGNRRITIPMITVNANRQ